MTRFPLIFLQNINKNPHMHMMYVRDSSANLMAHKTFLLLNPTAHWEIPLQGLLLTARAVMTFTNKTFVEHRGSKKEKVV